MKMKIARKQCPHNWEYNVIASVLPVFLLSAWPVVLKCGRSCGLCMAAASQSHSAPAMWPDSPQHTFWGSVLVSSFCSPPALTEHIPKAPRLVFWCVKSHILFFIEIENKYLHLCDVSVDVLLQPNHSKLIKPKFEKHGFRLKSLSVFRWCFIT